MASRHRPVDPVGHAGLCLLVLVVLFVVPIGTAHGPAVPADPVVRDDLMTVERAWSTTSSEPLVVDLVGDPYDRAAPSVAFRLHGDALLLEGALTVPERGRVAPTPVFNVGTRLASVVLAPPVALEGGDRLERVLLGPLDWDVPTTERREDAPGGLQVSTRTEVPWPDADGVSPPDGNETRTTGITLRLAVHTVGKPTAWQNNTFVADPHDPLLRSPAAAHIRLSATLPTDLRQPDGMQEQTAVLGVVFDFVNATRGRVGTTEGADGAAEGVWLDRGDRFAHLSFRSSNGTEGAENDTSFRYSAPARMPVPTTAWQRLSTPVSMNVTTSEARLGDEDVPSFVWTGRLGFMMPAAEWIVPPTTSPTPATDAGEAAGPALLFVALFAMAILHTWRRR
ncbi:MAG: hypothetical protein KY455_07060 [Euryarchaeota archaeon]|nr:hypothetical protein [Euryarchaeota archaeon]